MVPIAVHASNTEGMDLHFCLLMQYLMPCLGDQQEQAE